MDSFLIQNVRIFTGEEEIENGSVLVSEGKVHQVSSSRLDSPNESFKVISKPGFTLLPGFVDAHIHANGGNDVALPQALRFGVTTVCDMHNEVHNVAKLRKQTSEDSDAADYKTCSVAATIENGWPAPVVTAHDKSEETAREIATWPKLKTEADAKDYIQDRLADKVDYIKLMHESGKGFGLDFSKPSISLQKSVIDAAHANGLVAVAHALTFDDTLEILNAGIDGLTHTFLDKPPTQEIINAYLKNDAHCNPTLVAVGSLTTEGEEAQLRYSQDPRVKDKIREEGISNLCRCMSMAKSKGKVEYAYETVRQLKDAGVDIVCGSDAAGPALGTAWGLSVHHELALFVKHCGFTPAEAIRAATVVPAKRLRFQDRGKIATGLRADLVLVEGNPIQDIDHTLDLRAVWRAGKLCSTYKDKL